MSNGNIRYLFEFTLKLHIDHTPLLNYIRDTLGIGAVRERPKYNTSSFEISNEKELRLLIGLLDNTTLIGAKYLDFRSFRTAFFLYFDRTGLVTESLIAEIERIRENHNTKRTNFEMPDDYQRIITDYKLLGLIEGDGCFGIQRKGFSPKFELELTSSQAPLLEAVKDYLINKLGLDTSYLSKFRVPPIRLMTLKRANSNSKPSVRLVVVGVDLLHNYFNVYLNQLNFYSDKGKDFETFSFICKTLHSKAHLHDKQIKEQLLKLADGMNNARLSTNKKAGEVESEVNLPV